MAAALAEDKVLKRNKTPAPPKELIGSCRVFRIAFPVAILVVVLLVILFRFVLMPQSAEITRESVQIFHSNTSSLDSHLKSSDSLSVLATLELHNPNLAASFEYYNASFSLELGDEIIDRVVVPSGVLGSQKSANLSANLGSKDGISFDSTRSKFLTVRCSMNGYVHKWALFKHHFKVSSYCHAALSLPMNYSTISYHC